MAKFDTTGYLVVKICSRLNEKNIGRKCIPARWAENALCDNYLIIRYPKEENSETRVQVINKEPSKKTWPFYYALIMFRTDSYEKAIEFIAENDKQDSPAVTDEQADNTMNETKSSASATPLSSGKRIQSEENDKNSTNEDNFPKKKRESAIRSEASASATPSTSGKRIRSEENDKNSTNEDNPPKKKRESAIRSYNNLKMLILNKQLNCFPKQKVPPKKVLSLRKETRTETLETLISTGNFDRLEKLYTKTVASASLGSTLNDETVATDDNDSNNEPETIPPPDRNLLESVSKKEPNPTITTKNPGKSKTPLRENVIATDGNDSNNEPETIPAPDRNLLEPVSKKEPNPTITTKNPGKSKTPLRENVIATDGSDSNNEPETIPPPDRNLLEPVSKKDPNETITTENPGKSKTPLRENVIATDGSDSNNEPETIPPPDRNLLEPVSKKDPDTTITTENPGKSKTPLRENVIATDGSDSNNEPETIPPPDRNLLEPVSKKDPNPTITTENPGKSKTPLRENVIATDGSDSNNEPETIPPPDRNIPEPVSKNEPNSTNTTKKPERSNTPLPETVDSDTTQISSTNNLDQLRETISNVNGSQTSLNAEISALRNLICNLAPGNGTEHQNIVDIKHIEDIYNSILEVKRKMNAAYQEKSVQLKKAFESVNLFVPEIKKDLFLPTIEQIKGNSQPTSEEPKRLSSRQEPSKRIGPSHLFHPRTPSLQQSESSDSESFPQSQKPSTSSESKCSYVAKWTLKHQEPGSGLTELIPNTGIYVSEAELTQCKLLGTEMRQFARLLLPLIFTKEALSKCSYASNGRNGKRSRSRPGLDGHARNVLMDYVNKHAKESGWTIVGRVVMNQSLRDKLRVNYNTIGK